MTHSVPFRAAQSITLFGAIILSQVSHILFPARGVAPHLLMSFLLLAFAVTVPAILLPAMLRNRARARRWAVVHASLEKRAEPG